MDLQKKARVNLPDPVQMSFMKEADIDFGSLCARVETNMKQDMDEEKRQMCENFSFVTTNHQKMKSRLLNQSLSFMQQSKTKHYDFLKPFAIGDEAAPGFSNFC